MGGQRAWSWLKTAFLCFTALVLSCEYCLRWLLHLPNSLHSRCLWKSFPAMLTWSWGSDRGPSACRTGALPLSCAPVHETRKLQLISPGPWTLSGLDGIYWDFLKQQQHTNCSGLSRAQLCLPVSYGTYALHSFFLPPTTGISLNLSWRISFTKNWS